jgi:hypothetical protein
MEQMGRVQLRLNQKLILGGGYEEASKAIAVAHDNSSVEPALSSYQEEADSCMFLHVNMFHIMRMLQGQSYGLRTLTLWYWDAISTKSWD